MDNRTFDTITKMAEISTTRRMALSGGMAGLATLAAGRRVLAQDGTPEAITDSDPAASTDDHVEFLFVQPFAAGSWEPKEGEPDVYTLSLTGLTAQTIYFSDRPERIVGLTPTEQFLEGLGFTPADPPNAALVAETESGEQEILVLELFNPAYDAGDQTLTYDARVLAAYEDTGFASSLDLSRADELPDTFGAGSLFIDDCQDGTATCYQVVGGENVVVGPISDVGCCYTIEERFCKPCNPDAQASYYGNLCHQAWPDQCTYDLTDQGLTWDCYVESLACPPSPPS